MLSQKKMPHWSRRRHKDDQYMINGITGRFTYFPAGTFPEPEKLAEFNRGEERTYRNHHKLYYNLNSDGTETALCVGNNVEEMSVEEEETQELNIQEPENPFYKKKKETMKILYAASKCLSQENYVLFRDVFVYQSISIKAESEKLGVPRTTLNDLLSSIENQVFSRLKRKKK
jgi:hypothetical protein